MPLPVETAATLLPEETLDTLLSGRVKIIQPRSGYRFSLDPLLLCSFAAIPERARVADLGTGSAVIPLLLANSGKGRELVGIELQPDAASRARRSVALNGMEGQVTIVRADLRELPPTLAAGSFGAVVANPPYRKPSSGRVAPGEERGAARHELSGGLPDFLRAAAFLLNNRGTFCIIYLAERLAELLDGMRSFRLEPKRLRLVHSRVGEPARLVLVEGRKNAGAGLCVEPPLILYGDPPGRSYHEEVRKLLGA